VNITLPEEDYNIVSKTCGCKGNTRKITYPIDDSYHSLCRYKKDIIMSEILAHESVLKYTGDENDNLENKITELRLVLRTLINHSIN
jgi:hypothetical protein